MIVRLDAIGEEHPDSFIRDLLRLEVIGTEMKESLVDDITAGKYGDPRLVPQRSFWQGVYDAIYAEAKRNGHIRGEESVFSLEREIGSHLEYARQIWAGHVQVIRSGAYSKLFIERSGPSPITATADDVGVEVVYLNKGLRHKIDFLSIKIDRGSSSTDLDFYIRDLENEWVPLINSSITDGSLLISGRSHVQNEYGLVDKLRKYGVHVHILETEQPDWNDVVHGGPYFTVN